MPDYDFMNLSPYDFELVVRDLIQAELEIRLESFTSGPDKGIDFRHVPSGVAGIVVQAKRYAASEHRRLFRELRDVELPKIRRLNPDRYILATSVPLTPSRKDDLVDALRPYVLTPEEIFGRDDLNNLLGRHTDIEQAHFKLWLTSTAVLTAVLHNEIYVRSLSVREELPHRLRVYVQNKSFPEAMRTLDEHHAVVIAGVPGIGKSMLAEMIVVAHIADGYEAIVVSEDIAEAQRVYKPDRKQIFYYDDFLGQTSFVEKLPSKNESARLLSFMRQLARAPDKRLVMTTREYILAQAALRDERMERLDTMQKVVIDLKDYTTIDRAQILYNHLYFSNLSTAAVDSVASGRRYFGIIQHRNYSPRLIESVTGLARTRRRDDETFADFVIATFDDPQDLWRHAFQNQLDGEAQSVLIALATLPFSVDLQELAVAAESLHRTRAGADPSPGAFKRSLRILEGTFVATTRAKNTTAVFFHNPSIRDFMLSTLNDEPGEVEAAVRSFTFFRQGLLLWAYSREIPEGGRPRFQRVRPDLAGLRDTLTRSGDLLVDSLMRAYASPDCGLKVLHPLRDHAGPSVVAVQDEATGPEDRLGFLVDIVRTVALGDRATAMQFVQRRFEELLPTWAGENADREAAVRLITRLSDVPELRAMLDECRDAMRGMFVGRFFGSADDYAAFQRLNLLSPALFDRDEVSEIEDDFRSWAQMELDYALDESQTTEELDSRVDRIREIAEDFDMHPDAVLDNWRFDDVREELAMREDALAEDHVGYPRGEGAIEGHLSESRAIDSMFETLRTRDAP
jgi:hypothetical protein